MKKLILAILSVSFIAFLTGCSLKNGAQNVSNVDPSLPTPKNIKTISDMDSVAFEWDLIDDNRLEGFRLYRSEPNEGDRSYKDVSGAIEGRFKTHYADEKLTPSTQYFYQLVSVAKDGKESPKSKIVEAKTSDFEPVPYVEAISNYPRSAKIIWRPYPNPKVEGYIVERNDLGSTEWDDIKKVRGRLNVEYIDDGLDDNRVYKYRVIAYTYNGIKSPPSKVVEAKTKPLPPTLTGLEATKNLPRKIDIKWQPSKIEDFEHYNLYRSSKRDGSYDVISKLSKNSYSDPIESDGEVYFYKVTAVDQDHLESLPSLPVEGMSLPIPATPAITSATIEGKKAVIRWSAGDARAKSYIVTRNSGGWFKKEEIKFDDIKSTSFIDESIVPNIKYNYKVSAVDENGLISKPTDAAVLLLPAELKE
jgi:fibronectin type 3 domain-containing protein